MKPYEIIQGVRKARVHRVLERMTTQAMVISHSFTFYKPLIQ